MINRNKLLINISLIILILSIFMACQPGPLPPVDGIMPENGERLFANTNYTIRWPMPDPDSEEPAPENTLERLGEKVAIDLYKNGVFYSEIVASTDNTGNYNWKLYRYIDPDTDYSIRIMEEGNENNYADSDGTFTISKFRRIPAEWEELEGVWFVYTTGYSDFVPDMIKEVADVTKAFVMVESTSEESSANSYLNSYGVNMANVEFYVYNGSSWSVPVWIRDFGPMYVFEAGERKLIDFTHSYHCDDMPIVIGNLTDVDVIDGTDIELPGGIYISDGINTSFGSKALYVEPNGATFGNSYVWNVNHYSSETAFLDDLSNFTGNSKNIMIDYMDNDKTHHIDMWSKQLDENTFVVGDYVNQSDSNYTILNNVASFLEDEGYTVIRIPQPEQLGYKNITNPNSKFTRTDRYIKTTITYTNALFVNGGESGKKFLVPSYTDYTFTGASTVNQQVKTIYENALPDYEVVMINSDSIIGSGGSIHCTTMQVPKEDRHVSFSYQD